MDGEKKLVLFVVGLVVLCVTVLVVVLFVALWPYHQAVAFSLLGVGLGIPVLVALVSLVGKLNEQRLRRQRILYHHELPLDEWGRPLYLPGDAQPLPMMASHVVESRPHDDYGW